MNTENNTLVELATQLYPNILAQVYEVNNQNPRWREDSAQEAIRLAQTLLQELEPYQLMKTPEPVNIKQEFIDSFNTLSAIHHDRMVNKGFWNDEDDLINGTHIQYEDQIINSINGNKLALIASEISECLEALRHGDQADDKIPDFQGSEAELADVILRLMDLAARRKWRVAEALIAKMDMNDTREHKHGKLF